jgi:hypothetical protein
MGSIFAAARIAANATKPVGQRAARGNARRRRHH